jgi:hypothetical protein
LAISARKASIKVSTVTQSAGISLTFSALHRFAQREPLVFVVVSVLIIFLLYVANLKEIFDMCNNKINFL